MEVQSSELRMITSDENSSARSGVIGSKPDQENVIAKDRF